MKMDINLFRELNINFNISFWSITTVSLFGLFIYFIKNPEKFEKLVALIFNCLKCLSNKFDKTYVKYDLQGKINDYVKFVSKKVKHIDVEKVSIQWVDVENVKPETYVKNGDLIIRLSKSENQNKNIVNASMAFISHAFLKKAKTYVAKYQRESLDLYVCYDLLKHEKSEILDQFVQDFMREKMDNDKVADFFEKYHDIDRAGIFYPVLIQELTFLGEKVFGKKKDSNMIYDEVRQLVIYLNNYAHRKLREDSIEDFNGTYCKFAIRIIGKKFVINTQGKGVYIRNIKKINGGNETIYLIGNYNYKDFMKSVYDECKKEVYYNLFTDETYTAIIKDEEDNDMEVKNYMMILRNNKVQVYHK